MGASSAIAWTGSTLNIGRGCRRIDAGCLHCYAEGQAIRGSGPGGRYEGLVELGPNGPRWTGAVSFDSAALDTGVRWAEPRFVFVDSMSDAFYEGFTDAQIAALIGALMLAPLHVYQVLTKREGRAVAFFENVSPVECILAARRAGLKLSDKQAARFHGALHDSHPLRWLFEPNGVSSGPEPDGRAYDRGRLAALSWRDGILPHVWVGASCNDQASFDRRSRTLRRLRAPAVRFLSLEPLTGPIKLGDGLRGRWRREVDRADVSDFREHPIEWVILGGESGQRARPCDVDWIRSLVLELRTAGGDYGDGLTLPPRPVATFVKQLGTVAMQSEPYPDAMGTPSRRLVRLPLLGKGADPEAWPDDLLVQDFPAGVYLPTPGAVGGMPPFVPLGGGF